MKVNSINNNNTQFKSFYNSKALTKTLEFAEKNGALYASATSLTLSAIARPAAIFAAPKTDVENKKFACAKSIMSTLLDFVLTMAIAAPIVKGVSKINANPEKYLKKETIANLKEGAKTLSESKAYTLANQALKLGVGLIVAVPKSILNVLGIPYILEYMFNTPQPQQKEKQESLTFKGKGSESIAKIIGKTIDNKYVQETSKKFKDMNFPMHLNAAKDIIATGTFAIETAKSGKLKEERKGPLIYNSIISTGLCIASSYIIDSVTDKPAQKILNKIIEANKNSPKLTNYINGFKIAKPVIIMGGIYYIIIPIISTFLAERFDFQHPIKNPKNKSIILQ